MSIWEELGFTAFEKWLSKTKKPTGKKAEALKPRLVGAYILLGDLLKGWKWI